MYMSHKLATNTTTLKIASLRVADTVSIVDEYDNPMMLFAFGDRSVTSMIEKAKVFGLETDVYVIKFIQDEDNYTLLYLHKESLLPLKYEIIVANTKKNEVKNKITVLIEKGAGRNVNALAGFAVMFPVTDDGQAAQAY